MAGNLRNLHFMSTDATVLSIEHVSRVLIRWQLKPTTQDLTNLVFYVDRGESPMSLTQISVELPSSDQYEFVDYTAKLKNLEKLYYYRVRAVELVNDIALNTFTSDIFTWKGRPDLVALYIVEEHLFAYRHVYGTPALIFKKYKEGTYCPVCFDPVLKRITKSNCITCYGTSYLNGYYKPMEAWIDFDPDPKVAQIADWGERQIGQTDIKFTNYPILSLGDVIVELKGDRHWRVERQAPTEKNRNTLLQFCRLDEINRSDIEYKLHIPDHLRIKLLDELARRNEIPEF